MAVGLAAVLEGVGLPAAGMTGEFLIEVASGCEGSFTRKKGN